jgi:hypothetical protein
VRAAADPRHNEPVTDHRPYLVLADDGACPAPVLAELSAAYEVGIVRDAAQALAALRERPPRLLLACAGAPALPLVCAVRQDPALRDTPVILLFEPGTTPGTLGAAIDAGPTATTVPRSAGWR